MHREFAGILKSAGSTAHVDHAIVDGMPQPYGGQPRALTDDIFWDFELDSMMLYQMRSLDWPTAMATSGTVFYVSDSLSLPEDGVVDVIRFFDGVPEVTGGEMLASQSTVAVVVSEDGFESGDTSGWSLTVP